MKTKTLKRKFLVHLRENGLLIDLRRDVYIQNKYGLNPQNLAYDDAQTVCGMLYQWANDFIASNDAHYPQFGGFVHDLDITTEKLRTFSLSSLIDNVCQALAQNYFK